MAMKMLKAEALMSVTRSVERIRKSRSLRGQHQIFIRSVHVIGSGIAQALYMFHLPLSQVLSLPVLRPAWTYRVVSWQQ